jgi:hypothetical protein
LAHVHVSVLDYRDDALAAIGQIAHVDLHCTAATEAFGDRGFGDPTRTGHTGGIAVAPALHLAGGTNASGRPNGELALMR